LNVCAPQARFLAPDLHRRLRADWLCPRGLSARWEFVMRNRSATVAGFHGLPWFPKVSKERQAGLVLAGATDELKENSYQRIAIRRYVTCQSLMAFYVVGGVPSFRDHPRMG
jgi:hypothetical protein